MTILDATSSRVDRLGVYGGTRTWIGDATAAEGSTGLILYVIYFFWLDIPLCVVFDTVLLPVTIPYTLLRPSTELELEEAERADAEERRRERQTLPEVDRLIESLADPAVDADQQMRAIVRLGEVGHEDARVVPLLVDLLDEARGPRRLAILESLDRLGEVERVEAALDPILRELPFRSRRDPPDPKLVRVLSRHPTLCLRVAQNRLGYRVTARRTAVAALARLEQPDSSVVAALESLRNDSDLSADAAQALAAFAASPRKQDELARQAQTGSPEDRLAAIRALGAMEDPTDAARAALLRACADSEPAIRELALRSLRHVRGDEAIAALVDALADEALRANALLALQERGPEAAPAVPALIPLLQVAGLERSTCATLAAIGPAAEPAVPALVAAADGAAPPVHEAAIDALARIGGREAVSGLVSLLARGRAPALVVAALAEAFVHHEGERLTKLIEDDEQPEVVRSAAIAIVRQGKVASPQVLEALRFLAFSHPDGRETRLAKEAAAAFDYLRRGF